MAEYEGTDDEGIPNKEIREGIADALCNIT